MDIQVLNRLDSLSSKTSSITMPVSQLVSEDRYRAGFIAYIKILARLQLATTNTRKEINKQNTKQATKISEFYFGSLSLQCHVSLCFRNQRRHVPLKPGFHIFVSVVSVVSVVRKKFIGQIQLYGNLPYKCSIQKTTTCCTR